MSAIQPRPRAGRIHPIRAAALVCLLVGLVLLAALGAQVFQGVQEQQHLNQVWQGEALTRTPSNPAAIDPSLKQPVKGVDFAIKVPRLHYFAAVKEGTDSGTLFASPGHYPQSMWPGDQGTVGVAAHNVYWINFPELKNGDEIDIDTRYGLYRYHVTATKIVNPDDRTVLIPDAPGYHLTLTTCWPLWAGAFATQRYVIFSDQYWPVPSRQPLT